MDVAAAPLTYDGVHKGNVLNALINLLNYGSF